MGKLTVEAMAAFVRAQQAMYLHNMQQCQAGAFLTGGYPPAVYGALLSYCLAAMWTEIGRYLALPSSDAAE